MCLVLRVFSTKRGKYFYSGYGNRGAKSMFFYGGYALESKPSTYPLPANQPASQPANPASQPSQPANPATKPTSPPSHQPPRVGECFFRTKRLKMGGSPRHPLCSQKPCVFTMFLNARKSMQKPIENNNFLKKCNFTSADRPVKIAVVPFQW